MPGPYIIEKKIMELEKATTYYPMEAGGTVNGRRLVKPDASGKAVVGTVDSKNIIGAEADNAIRTVNQGINVALGFAKLVASQPVEAGYPIKCYEEGRSGRCVDADNEADEILSATAGGNFGNQPTNDGVEVISDSASDVQDCTIYGTTNGTATVVKETITLTGTSPKSTVKTDWGEILGVILASAAVGTITIREASGDLTITTITATNTLAGMIVPDGETRGFNVKVTAVASGASTKKIAAIGYGNAYTEMYDNCIALNGTTTVILPTEVHTVEYILVGDVASGTNITVNVGSEEDENIKVGKSISPAAARGNYFDAKLSP